jgi:twitching motility protein PilT
MIESLFEELLNRGGSDLHLAVNQPPLARVRGEIVVLREAPIAAKELEEMLLGLVSASQRNRLAADLDLDLAIPYKDVARFRATLYVKHPGIAATFRLVPTRVPSLAELGCPEVLWKLADRRAGLVVVGSPASNGKTTTVAAMVDHINKTRACHVLTLESPIEVVHVPLRAQITQREIGTHVPSLELALRGAARESADVIVTSELQQPEEIELALRLASAGMLVIAPFATSHVYAVLERFLGSLDVAARGPMQRLLSDALAGIVVQHLVRVADSKTRIAMHEILVATPEVVSIVREGRIDRIPEAIRGGGASGMVSIDDALERLVATGKITAEAAMERAFDKEEMARALARSSPGLVDTLTT